MLLKHARPEEIRPVEEAFASLDDPPAVADVRRTGGTVEVTVVYADRPVSVDDCAFLAGVLAKDGKVSAAFGEGTVFAVASPGLGRRLTTDREFETFAGRQVVAAWLDRTTMRERTEVCLLGTIDTTGVTLRIDGSEDPIKVGWDDLRSVRLPGE